MKFGVVRFPGSCDEVDALMACRRFGDGELLWHADKDLHGCDAIVIPGGFEGVSGVRVGRLVELEVEATDRVHEMCERLLANPLIEDYEVFIERPEEG